MSSDRNDGISTACGIRKIASGITTLSRWLTFDVTNVERRQDQRNWIDCLAERIPVDGLKVPFGDGEGNSRGVDGIGIAFPKDTHGEVLFHSVSRIHALLDMRILLAH